LLIKQKLRAIGMVEEPAPRHGAAILVVDDNDQIRGAIADILEQAGYRVAVAPNAGNAAALIADLLPDLVITDIFMPEGDGFEMMNAIRRQSSSVPVIAISGGSTKVGTDYLKLAAKFGAAAILYKPFGKEELLSAVAQGLARRNPPLP
jgi:CheY-like chemotaxis protein